MVSCRRSGVPARPGQQTWATSLGNKPGQHPWATNLGKKPGQKTAQKFIKSKKDVTTQHLKF